MEDVIRLKLERINRTNKTLYFSILAGMFTILAVAVVFEYSDILQKAPLTDPYALYTFDRILLFIVLFLLLMVIFIKRVFLLPKKLIASAIKSKAKINASDISDLISGSDSSKNILAKAVNILRRWYMVIWSTANLVMLLAFTGFILTGNFKIFLVYSAVSLYSSAINFPVFTMLEKCYYISNDAVE